MRRTLPATAMLSVLLATVLSATPALAADPPPWRSAQQILDASPDSDWRTPDPANLLYMELDAGRVVIELAPGFAPEHVANIRTLAGEGFWDGTSINRVQDNYVVQWGDADGKKPLPAAVTVKPPAEYVRPLANTGFRALGYPDAYAISRNWWRSIKAIEYLSFLKAFGRLEGKNSQNKFPA